MRALLYVVGLTALVARADDVATPPGGDTTAGQDRPVLIANRLRRRPVEAMEVVLARVDEGVALDRTAGQNALSAGLHQIEALCVTRHPGGMANFTRQSTTLLRLDARPGSRYRLDGVIDDNGRCTAVLLQDDAYAHAPDS